MERLPPRQQRFRFGAFEADLAQRRVYRRGLPLRMRGQAFDVLVALLEHQGDVVTREELRRRLWPDGTFVEAETALNSIVNRVRLALGDTAARARYIETIPRVGYRFRGLPHEDGEVSPAVRIAVLPFVNLSGDSAQEYLADGLTEEMISQLAVIGGRLAVIARTSSMHYKGSRKSVSAIGRELRADYLLEGSVRRSGDQLRVTAQLVRAEGEDHLWARNFNGGLGDVLRFQEEVAHAIAAEVRASVAPVSAPTVVPEAYDAYIRARVHAARIPSPEMPAAIRLLEEAVHLDPSFGRAWGLMGFCWAHMAFWGYASAQEAYPKAATAALKAIASDPLQSEAHRAMAAVHWYFHWDLDACRREYELAVRVNPNDATGRVEFAVFLCAMENDVTRADAEAEQARDLDPLSGTIWGHSAWLYFWTQRYEAAISLCRRTLSFDPRSLGAHYVLAVSYAGLGRLDESIKAAEDGLAVSRDCMLLSFLAMVHGYAGRPGRALEILGELEERARTRYVFPTCFASVYMGLGRYDEAMNWVERAIRERDVQALWLTVSPRWQPLKSFPRFAQLVEGLPRRLQR